MLIFSSVNITHNANPVLYPMIPFPILPLPELQSGQMHPMVVAQERPSKVATIGSVGWQRRTTINTCRQSLHMVLGLLS